MARGSSILSALEVWLAQRRIPRVLFYYIAVNVLVFLVVKLLVITLQGIAPDAALSLFYSFALPSDLGRLASHPWTLFTHFFFHQSFTHLLFNMLWLWVFGRMFLEHFTSRQFHWVYWLGVQLFFRRSPCLCGYGRIGFHYGHNACYRCCCAQ